jgi:hypothetical protein
MIAGLDDEVAFETPGPEVLLLLLAKCGMSPCCSHCRAGDRNSNGLVEARHVRFDRIAPAQTRTSTPVKNPFLAVFILAVIWLSVPSLFEEIVILA